MSIGFSDGGRMSVIANMYNQDEPEVLYGVGMGGHPFKEYDTSPDDGSGDPGLTGNNGMETDGIRMHSYHTDSDLFYESTAYTAYATHSGLGLTANADTVSTLGTYTFTQHSWSKDCCGGGLSQCQNRVVLGVHDWTDTPSFGATGNVWSPTSHLNFAGASGVWAAIYENTLDQFLVDVGNSGPCGPPILHPQAL